MSTSKLIVSLAFALGVAGLFHAVTAKKEITRLQSELSIEREQRAADKERLLMLIDRVRSEATESTTHRIR